MPYVKQVFLDGKTVLSAAHLEYIEDGIVAAFAEIPKFVVKTIALPAANWSGSDGIFSQTVEVSGITALSKIDPMFTPAQLQELLTAEISIVFGSDEGSVTAFAIGDAPTSDFDVQVMVTQVVIESTDGVEGGDVNQDPDAEITDPENPDTEVIAE